MPSVQTWNELIKRAKLEVDNCVDRNKDGNNVVVCALVRDCVHAALDVFKAPKPSKEGIPHTEEERTPTPMEAGRKTFEDAQEAWNVRDFVAKVVEKYGSKKFTHNLDDEGLGLIDFDIILAQEAYTAGRRFAETPPVEPAPAKPVPAEKS